MAQFEQHFIQDLTQQIKVRHCGSIVFNADNESNVVSVRLFNGSEPVAISGSVVGAVVCSDGSTVPLTGSYSGNTASITLTGDCFAVLGQIGVGIQIVNGTQKTTVLKAIYNVETFSTDDVVDPGSRITLSVSDLIDDIETAVASIPADYSDLLAAIAPNYSGLTFPVKAGTFCWYNGALYQAQQGITTSEAWTAAHWASAVLTTSLGEKLADVDDELSDLKSNVSALEARTEYPVLLNGWDSVDFEYGFITDSGNVTSNQGFRATTFIPVSEGDVISYYLKGYNNVVYTVTAYDSTKTRIAEASVNGGKVFNSGTYTVASGTAYIRLCSDTYASAEFSSDDVYGTAATPIKEYIAEELPKKLDIQQSSSDAGKLLGIGEDGVIEAKTIQTEIADNSITYEKLQKSVFQIQQSIVDFWYYNGEKRTDGKSIEVVLPLNVVASFEYPTDTNKYRVYYASDDGTVLGYTDLNTEYFRINDDETNHIYTLAAIKAGKFYIPVSFGSTQYFPENTIVNAVEAPYPINFLKNGWQPDIMNISVKYPREVYPLKSYNHNGAVQPFGYKIKTYHIPYVGWYKVKANFNLLDSDWDFIRTVVGSYFYNDGSIAYVQGRSNADDVDPEYVGDGIQTFNDMRVVSKWDKLDINKPIGNAIVCFGDSITSTGYPAKLEEIAECIALNYGASGNDSNKIRKVATGIGSENVTPFDWSANPVDTVLIMAGYNDTYQGDIAGDIPATTIEDAGDNWSDYLTEFNASHYAQGTTTGNVGFMIEWIQVNHPDVRILLCNYHNNTDDGKPTRSADIDIAVQALSEYYGIQFIDVRRTCGINKKNASTYLTDGLHPNSDGQMLIAKAIMRGM